MQAVRHRISFDECALLGQATIGNMNRFVRADKAKLF